MFRKTLFQAFFDWINKHEEVLGKWYGKLLKEGKKAEDDCDTPLKIMATSMWIFNMIAQFGVQAGIGPNKVNLHKIPEELDEQLTKRLLHLCATCLSLQYLPKDIATKEIPIISGTKFSLKVWLESR